MYVDGFNLYYGVLDFDEPFLKWCNLWRLAEEISVKSNCRVVKVVFCTAIRKDANGSALRHRTLNNALEACGVTIIKGHYIFDKTKGSETEKQSDINVALSLIVDGFDDIYDVAYLLSADSDQAATARVFKERFPNKKLIIAAPPNRQPPDKARNYSYADFSISKEHIERSVMPGIVQGRKGPIVRPAEYAPPKGWLHPDERPARRRR